MQNAKQNIFQTLKIISLALILTTGLSIALAWTGPTAAPPGNNTDEPLNTSNNWQTKYGYLSLPKLIDSNDGQTGYYLDPGANSWLYRLYSYDIRSSIFYDQDNTGYYVDPASTSKLNRVDASIVYDRDNTAYYSNPASTSYYNDMRANIYYDKGNTGYYVDPASTSKFNAINLGGVSKSSWPSDYYTKSETYTKEQINAMIAAIETGGGCPVSYTYYEQSTETAQCYLDGEVISVQYDNTGGWAHTGWGSYHLCEARIINGNFQTRATYDPEKRQEITSGWVNGVSEAHNMYYTNYKIRCTPDWFKVKMEGTKNNYVYVIDLGESHWANVLQIQ